MTTSRPEHRPARRPAVAACLLALAVAGCASMTYRGYPDGGLKFSPVKYDYTAQPHLREGEAETYRVATDAALAGVTRVAALESRGLSQVERGGDVVVRLSGGEVSKEPGSFGLGGSYKPALLVRMPVRIVVEDASGDELVARSFRHEEALGIPGAQSYETRTAAKEAMASISGFTAEGAEREVREGAAKKVATTMTLVAKDLYEPREVSVTLPAIRSAGDVDMEAAYGLLAEAKSPVQVEDALAAYQALGTDHEKTDGTPDVVANYGVLVGTASAKVLAGDLAGAWSDTKAAWETYPEGQEHGMVARVLVKQQEETGVEFIPEEDMDKMNVSPAKALQDALQRMGFGEKKKK
jgi:hypothetical protein